MFKNMKALPKAIILGAIAAGAVFAGKVALNLDIVQKYTAAKPTVPVSVPDKIDLPTTVTAGTSGSTLNAAAVSGESIRVKVLAWNGVSGLTYAKASGALKAKGLNVDIKREDDYSKMIADLASFAKDPATGVHFVVIMGDGYPAFTIGANEALKPFNQNVSAIAGIGYSRGEDKCVIAGDAEPRGSLIAGVMGDGDINICIKYASDNGIPVNADQKVYAPNAMNFTGVSAFTDADQKFISGNACEERTNTETGKKQSVCVNGTATWTPGDTNVFSSMKKVGKSIRVLASTKEYAYQMPALLIGNKQWMAKHRDVVKALLAATFEGGEKVRSDNAALMVAAAENAKVFGEQDAGYWAELFNGTTETGPDGKKISLGGSTTNGIADAAFMFGLNGADPLFKKVYTVYGNIAVKYFPDIMSGGLRKFEDVVDTSYVAELLQGATNVAKAATPVYTTATTGTFAAKAVSIEFETGKATFTPKAIASLNAILDDAAVTSLNVQINGHTDNVGDPAANLALSKARAEAVRQFLMTNAPANFPAERVASRGFGDTQPIGDNKTAAGKAQNRRVEVLLKK